MGGRSIELSYSDTPAGSLWNVSEILLRLSAALLSVAGLVVMAKDKQVITLNINGVPLPLEAKHSYVEAFVYLVYANGIVSIYCFLLALALIISLVRKPQSRKFFAAAIFLVDQALAYLLLAAAAASTEVAYIAKRGNDKVSWSEVCSQFSRFCNLVGVSLVLTFLSVLAMVFLSIMSARRLFSNHGAQARQTPSNQALEI